MRTPAQLINRVSAINDWLMAQKNLHRDEHARVGAEAAAVRKARGMSLRDVAGRMGMSAPFLSDLELGRRLWTTETTRTWAAAIQQQNINAVPQGEEKTTL